jgi:hypothetical protein
MTPSNNVIDPKTLLEIERAYQSILRAVGYGTIRIRIERAGQKRESQFVSIEIERKTK